MRKLTAIILIVAFILLFAALGCAPIVATEESAESVIYHATHPQSPPVPITETP